MIHNAIRGCTYKPARDTSAGELGMWLVLDPRNRNHVLAWCESEAEARAFCVAVDQLVERVYEQAIDVRLAGEAPVAPRYAMAASRAVPEDVADDFTPIPTPVPRDPRAVPVLPPAATAAGSSPPVTAASNPDVTRRLRAPTRRRLPPIIEIGPDGKRRA